MSRKVEIINIKQIPNEGHRVFAEVREVDTNRIIISADMKYIINAIEERKLVLV